jgi:hypothetical protein
MSLYEITNSVFLGLTALGALAFGLWQILINRRLLALQFYAAIVVVPWGDKIKVLNTGKGNLYLHGYDLAGKKTRLDKPRLLATGTLDQAYYWIHAPSQAQLSESKEFNLTLYLKDESGSRYVSEHGGRAEKSPEGSSNNWTVFYWSYRTIKCNWDF